MIRVKISLTHNSFYSYIYIIYEIFTNRRIYLILFLSPSSFFDYLKYTFYLFNIYIVASYCISLSIKNVHTRGTPALTNTSTTFEQSVFSHTHNIT